MEKSTTEHLGYVVFLAVIAALGGFLFGYDTAVISGTIKNVSAQFHLDDIQTGWYVGCALIGSICGVLVAGKLSDRLGRRPVLLFSAVLFSISAIGCMLCASETELVWYRIIGGIGIGIASIISPLYISEIALPRYRGRLVALYQLAITVGIVTAYFANAAILRYSLAAVAASGSWVSRVFVSEVWRGMLGMETLPALLFFIVLFFIPESPRWLVINHREQRAESVLSRMIGKLSAQRQVSDIQEMLRHEVKSDWRLLLQPGFRTVLLVGVSLAMLGQFMGVNAVLYYGPILFEEAGMAQGSSLDFQIIVGLVNVFSTLLAVWLIDRIGRKKLVYIGVTGMIITLVGIAAYFILNSSRTLAPEILLALIMLYIFCCAISICAVIFVLLSEMYPVKVRGAAMSIAGFSLWVGTYLIGQLTPWLLSHIAPSGVFLLFACMCFPYLFITWKYVPETTGRSLEEIEQEISKGKQNKGS